MKRAKIRKVLGLLLASTSLTELAVARAETRSDPAVLTEITVTAKRPSSTTTEDSQSYTAPRASSATGLDLSLRDTPQSLSVITYQRLQDQRLERVIDVINATTGLSAKQYEADRFSLYSRGMSITNILYDGVPTFYDTRFNYGDNAMDTALYDRVEVVRGATGLTTGPGNPSASVNLMRKKPTADFQGSALLGLGSWNAWRSEVDVAGPINASGTVRGRLVGAHQENQSFLDRYRQQRDVLYGVIETDLSSDTLLTVGMDYQKNRTHGTISGGLPLFYSDGSRTNYPRSASTAQPWSKSDTTAFNAFASLRHTLNENWQLQASFAYGHNQLEMNNAYVYGTPNAQTNVGLNSGAFSKIEATRIQHASDLRLSGNYQLLGRQHKLNVGLNLNEQNFNTPYYYPSAALPPLGNFLTSGYGIAEPAWSSTSTTGSDGRNKQQALYAVTQLSLTDPLSLILGGRFTNYQSKTNNFGTRSDADYNEFSFYGGINYAVTDTTSVYASYTDIFTPQTVLDANAKALVPEIGQNREIGVKAALLDNAVNVSAAVFDIDRQNIAQAVPGQYLPGRVQVYHSVGSGKTRGFETEISGQLAKGWNLTAGYTVFSSHDDKGQALSITLPRRQFKLFSSYQLPGAWNQLTLGGGANWQSQNSNIVNRPDRSKVKLEEGSYALWSLMARYDFDKQLSLTVNVENVFDKTYYSQLGQYDQYQYGRPRNINATLRRRF